VVDDLAAVPDARLLGEWRRELGLLGSRAADELAPVPAERSALRRSERAQRRAKNAATASSAPMIDSATMAPVGMSGCPFSGCRGAARNLDVQRVGSAPSVT